MLEDIKFQSYCWSLGTTSFRVKDLNFKIERQLQILKEVWNENQNVRWNGNNSIQEEYYNKKEQVSQNANDILLKASKVALDQLTAAVATQLNAKQAKLTAGTNITINPTTNEISSTGGSTTDAALTSKTNTFNFRQIIKSGGSGL